MLGLTWLQKPLPLSVQTIAQMPPPPSGDSPHKGQVKAKRQLEVQLDGCTLVVPSDGIFDFNIDLQQHTEEHESFLGWGSPATFCGTAERTRWSDLGAIERSIARVQFPGFPELVQTVLQLLRSQEQGSVSANWATHAVVH